MKAKAVSHETVLKSFKRQQLGDAELLSKMFSETIIFDIEEEKWYLWKGNYWGYDRSKQIYNLIGNQLADRYYQASTKEKDETDLLRALINRVALLRDDNYMSKVIKQAQRQPDLFSDNGIWDKDPYALGCSNCVIDLRTGEARQGQQKDYIRTIIPTEYLGLDLIPCRFERFLLEIFECNTKKIRFLQRVLGYAITGLSSEHIFPILSGQGRNGKDTLMQIIEAVLGLYIAGPAPAEILLASNKNPHAATPLIWNLRYRRLVYVNETNDGARIATGQAKLLTGGSTLTGRALYGNDITFTPQHLLMLITNPKPQAPGDDYAFWQRVFSIEFGLSFIDDPDPQKPNERKADTKLYDALLAELPSILSWLVRGCLMWQEEGLNPPECVKLATKIYQEGEDTLGEFLNDQMDFGSGKMVGSKILYEYYKEWMKDGGHYPLSNKRFSQKIEKRYTKSDRKRDGYYFFGLEPKAIDIDELATIDVFEGFD